MNDQRGVVDKGGTMRLGAFECLLNKKSKSYRAYQQVTISERHRHRFEFNNQFRGLLEKSGMDCVGINPGRDLVEVVEIASHPWFVGVQFHPEFQSRPLQPHPLFEHFVKASLARVRGKKK